MGSGGAGKGCDCKRIANKPGMGVYAYSLSILEVDAGV